MITSPDTGQVRLRIACAAGRVSDIHIRSERPDVARLLRGRTVEQATRLIPMLYALCSQAQSRAAMLAAAAATGRTLAPEIAPAVQREALREHLWHCLLDLPPLLGKTALQQEFVTAANWVAENRRTELLALLDRPNIQALHLSLLHQPTVAAIPPARLLPPLSAENSLDEWSRLSPAFCRQPEWRGEAAETGALARRPKMQEQTTSHITAHWLARFEELRDWAQGGEPIGCVGTVSSAAVTGGTGRALVETARGILMHEIVLDGGHIADYSIVAPTEWNFHPRGTLARYLLDANARDRNSLRQYAEQLVATLDPCVPWQLEWA